MLEIVPIKAFKDNYVWTLRNRTHAAVVDPGEAQPVLDYLGREKLVLAAILATHHHADHVGGIAELRSRFDVPVFGPRNEPIATLTHPVGGCGRLFEGTAEQMYDSLGKLARLPDDTKVYCGHEYTLANIGFAKAVEPGNAALARREQSDRGLREAGRPTLPSTLGEEKATNPFLRCVEPAVVDSVNKYLGSRVSDPVRVFAAIRDWKNKF